MSAKFTFQKLFQEHLLTRLKKAFVLFVWVCLSRARFATGIVGCVWSIAAAASEPEANERGSSLINRRLHYRGLQSLFLTRRKELWLWANGRFRMRGGMPQGIVVMREWEDLGCAVIWHKELWLCANGWFRMRSEPCAFLSLFSLFVFILQILTRVSKRY